MDGALRSGNGRDFEFIEFWICTTESLIRLSLYTLVIKAEAAPVAQRAQPNQIKYKVFR
jgi:hypothetical protein